MGSVVVFSLIFWIPLSILVHCVVRPAPHEFPLMLNVANRQSLPPSDTSEVGTKCCHDWNPFTLSNAEMCVTVSFTFLVQDKRLDQQYEENTKCFYFPPSVSFCSLKRWYTNVFPAKLTKLTACLFFLTHSSWLNESWNTFIFQENIFF